MNNRPFYDPALVGTLFYPSMREIAADAAAANLSPAAGDAEKGHLVIIDMQVDFCHPSGSLYVPGAEEDIRRLIDFIFANAGAITQITCTLDSHLPFQIFHPAWWADRDGNHPAPLTIISYADVAAGTWRPLRMADESRDYVRRLEENARKQLTIWPYHVLIGSTGNMLDPSLWSVVMWHALARGTQPVWITKGTIPQTEHYSAIRAEIPVPGQPASQKNASFLRSLADSDRIFVAGEAQSHCVVETVADIVTEFSADSQKLRSLYVLEDCMSPVLHPAVDFGAIARERFATFADLGVRLVASTDGDLTGR